MLKAADIVAVQEPYIDRNNRTRANLRWTAVYPSTHDTNPAHSRSLLLVSTNLSTDAWSPLSIPSPDITGIIISSPHGRIIVYNVYNDCTHSHSLQVLRESIDNIRRTNDLQTNHMIWLGDFNRHHPMWDDVCNTQLFTNANLDAAEYLLHMIADYGMEMTLAAGTPTIETFRNKTLTRPDNVFISPELAQHVTTCTVHHDHRPIKTDHFPINTILDLSVPTFTPRERRNFKAVNWEEFGKYLEQELSKIPRPTELRSVGEAKAALDRLLDALDATIEQIVPIIKTSPFAKRWWTPELTKARDRKRKAANRHYRNVHNPSHKSHEEYRRARNLFIDLLRKTRLEHWIKFLQTNDPTTLWTANRIVSGAPSDGGKERVPTLQYENEQGDIQEASAHSDKSHLLFHQFFVPAPQDESSLNIPENPTYPDPAFEFSNITDDEIYQAIGKLAPFKAPGPNGIPNAVFIHAAEHLVPFMGPIYRATFNHDFYPEQWQQSRTVVLRKPGKPSYTVAKSYRPIALMDTMGKILSSCVASSLAYEAEKLQLLPINHFGGRKGRCTTDAIHTLIASVKNAWRRGDVVSVLFLDVQSAFPSTVPKRLFHNMRMRGVPAIYTEWLSRKMTGRTTILDFNDIASSPFEVTSGLDQGCPLSPILYLFYNTPLLELSEDKKGELSVAFLDDSTLACSSKSLAQTRSTLHDMMHRPSGALQWSREHNSSFELSKLVVMDFVGPGKPPEEPPPLIINGVEIKPAKSHKFLGVIIDHKLRGTEHAAYALRKATNRVQCIRRLASVSYGLSPHYARTLYFSVVIPSMLYAADTFLLPIRNILDEKHEHGTVGIINKLQRIQRSMAIFITGGMVSSPTDVLDAHAGLLPFPLLVNKHLHRATTRLAALPSSHPLHPLIQQASKRYVKRHRHPLHELFHRFGIVAQDVEKIASVRYHPQWSSSLPVQIAPSKDEAKAAHRRNKTKVRIYTDGSSHSGGVGASAVLLHGNNPDPKRALRFYLGSPDQHTVFEAELVGLILAIHLLQTENHIRKAIIFVDNQAALRCTELSHSNPGHHLVDLLHKQIKALKRRKPRLIFSVQWIPGHEEIHGNEVADAHAKKAASGKSSAKSSLPKALHNNLPLSVSSLRQAYLNKLQADAAKIWSKSKRHERIVQLDRSMAKPRKHFLKLIQPLSRTQSSLLFQLRTGHIPLNSHLHRIKRSDTPFCPSCPNQQETVRHFILECTAYSHIRSHYFNFDHRLTRSLRPLLSHPKLLKPLLCYVQDTRRLSSVFGNVALFPIR